MNCPKNSDYLKLLEQVKTNELNLEFLRAKHDNLNDSTEFHKSVKSKIKGDIEGIIIELANQNNQLFIDYDFDALIA